MKRLGLVRESSPGESRVALVPEVVKILAKSCSKIYVEKGAGEKSLFSDEEYSKAGAEIISDRKELIAQSDIIAAINGSEFYNAEVGSKTLIALFDAYFQKNAVAELKEKGARLLALEFIPRISRAQSMDVLSSQANLSGYVAVLKAAGRLDKAFPLMMTAAGTIKPAKILVLGAGVAGLMAIATAKRLGALVFAYDVRAAVKEQVESLGAKFVDISLAESGEGSGGYAKALSQSTEESLRAKLSDFAKDMDIIICTAQIPGKRAPLLLDESIFSKLREGAIIIDLAAASGGNVLGSKLNEWLKIGRAFVFGAESLSREVPKDASFTFAKNLQAIFTLFLGEGKSFDIHDEILRELCLCQENKWVNEKFAAAQNNK
jgi:NAD(P) transhydrogenase subunit alpha